jgi:thioredoxin-dependent peroxiredoxin
MCGRSPRKIGETIGHTRFIQDEEQRFRSFPFSKPNNPTMKLLKSILAAFSLTSFAAAADAPLAVGAAAPDVTSKDQDGKAVSFKDVYAKGPTLVYFYPKANTPGCTKQGCSLRDNWDKLKEKGIQVLGVSEDKPEAQKSFRDKFTFPFPLIADDDGKVAAAFRVPVTVGFAKRQSFLIKDGKIAWTMLEKTSTATHADDVLKAIEGLK